MEQLSYQGLLPEGIQVLRWPHTRPLSEEDILGFFNARGLRHTRWSNGPGEIYGVHAHVYRKTLFCLEGSITFSLPDRGQEVELRQGDRLILAAGIHHGAIVGPKGVTCIEAAE